MRFEDEVSNEDILLTLDEIIHLRAEVLTLKQLFKEARNELCRKCGQFRNLRLGGCSGCFYADTGEWRTYLESSHR